MALLPAGVHFTMVTDHSSVTHLQTQPFLCRCQVKWSDYLQAFRFRWQYRPDRINVDDPLSRLHAMSVAAVIRGQSILLVPNPDVNPSTTQMTEADLPDSSAAAQA